MATNCCYNLPFVTALRTPGSGAVALQYYMEEQYNMFHTEMNPADNTIHIFGNQLTAYQTSAGNDERSRVYLGDGPTGTDLNISAIQINTYARVPGTSEQMTLELYKEGVMDLEVSTSIDGSISNYRELWEGTHPITDDTGYTWRLTTPTFVTNPVGFYLNITVIYSVA